MRAVFLLAILCHPKPLSLVRIEEPELGLHPDVLPTLAELLKEASERTLYRLASAKQIPAFKVGGIWRLSRADIDEWIRRQSAEPLDGLQADDQSGGRVGTPA